MIINQEIVGGICVINRTGQYFSLVSASGIVQVKLKKNGTTVFTSKMWVGMNLPTPVPFDEIEIFGEDAPIEVWASSVAMNQSLLSMTGAKAVRTAVHLVYGEQQIVSPELARQAVRVRSDKDIYLGGSGFGVAGWRLPAGEVGEVPVSGLLSAYKPEAFLDYSSPAHAGLVDGIYEAGLPNRGQTYLSPDGMIRVVHTDYELRTTVDGGATWALTFSSVYGYKVDPRTGMHYVLQLKGASADGRTIVFSRSRDGVNWELMYRRAWVFPEGGTTGGVFSEVHVIGRWFHRTFSGMIISVDIETGETLITTPEINGQRVDHGCWIDDALKVGIFSGMSIGKLYKTEDGGLSWRLLADNYYYASFDIDSTGKHVLASINSRPHVSDDFGESWTQCGSLSWNGEPTVHIAQNLWVSFYSGRFVYVDKPGDSSTATGGSLTPEGVRTAVSALCFNPESGLIYSTRSHTSGSHQCNIEVVGDISAARVEVMELLA